MFATIALTLALTLAGPVYSQPDVSYVHQPSNNYVVVIPKPNQTLVSACRDALRLGFKTNNLLVKQTIDNQVVYVWCKYD